MSSRQDARRLAYGPSEAEVLAALEEAQPATVMDVLHALPEPWCRQWALRGTVRNRLYALEEAGRVIDDEGRPLRFAVNELGNPAGPAPGKESL